MMWVFTPSKKQKSLTRLIMFFVLSTMGLFINNGIMWFTVEVLAISYIIGKLVATFIVMVFNYITRKILIEGRKKREAQAEHLENDSTATLDTANAMADANTVSATAGVPATENK